MQIAPYIDHTYLKPDCTEQVVDRLIREADDFGFKAICIPPVFIPYAREKARERSFLLCTVAGFPIGYDHLGAKLNSLRVSAESGAEEVDVVVNLSAIKDGHWDYTKRELTALREVAISSDVVLKCIIEAQLLQEDEILRICEISNELELPYVKTSTGFFGDAVKAETVRLMRKHLRPSIRIKASGGISSYTQAVEMIQAGADRLGCSQSVKIVEEGLRVQQEK